MSSNIENTVEESTLESNNNSSNSSLEKSSNLKSKKKLAPMLEQYLEYKKKYEEQVVLFQVGDFYEVFYDDAKTVSSLLDIRLTARHKDQPNPVPMCGFPVHGLNNFLPRIISKGVGCVVVSQVESGSSNQKGLVRREIERIITPGLRYQEDGLDESSFNYLASVSIGPGGGGISYIDVSTGVLKLEEIENEEELLERLRLLEPSEVILPSSFWGKTVSSIWLKQAKKLCNEREIKAVSRSFKMQDQDVLAKRISNLISKDGNFKCDFSSTTPAALSALAAVIDYVEDYSFDGDFFLSSYQTKKSGYSVVVDSSTRQNLEIVNLDDSLSLVKVLDETKTAFGSRLLRERLLFPEVSIEKIENRLQGIETLFSRQEVLTQIRESLSSIRDFERLSTRISSGRISPYDIGQLRDSIQVIPEIKNFLSSLESGPLLLLNDKLDSLEDIHSLLCSTLVDEPPIKLSDGGLIRERFSAELDELINISRDANSCLLKFEEEEKVRSEISALKVKYNNVFGYFIEISKANLAKVEIPLTYQRKQTLTNAERYITPELKELEVKILSAKTRQIALEKEIFSELKERLAKERIRIQKVAKILAELDVLASGAYSALRYNYVKPKITDLARTSITRGRHPVVERIVGADKFVSNDCFLEGAHLSSGANRSFAILSGPNMGGKSTYMRQIGLIQLMSQAGFYVPAEKAEIGVVDRIFTRIGASDNLQRGESTFMVEMREAAVISKMSTKNSLVLVDELGRGTATNDGYALAQAILEWLHDKVGCRTIFATHFHGLSKLAEEKENIFPLSVGANKLAGSINFTYTIEDKAASGSYGTEVAKLAGLPKEILQRAETILRSGSFQKKNESSFAQQISLDFISSAPSEEDKEKIQKADSVLAHFEKLDMNSLSPIEALNELFKIKNNIE